MCHESINNLQLSPKGEVNSGGYIRRREVSRYDIFIVLKQFVYFATDVGRKNEEK